MNEATIAITKTVPSKEDLRRLCKGSALTMLGYLPEELELYINELAPFIAGKTVTVYQTLGIALAETFSVELPATLNVFIVDLDELKDVPKLAVTLRMARGYRWLDDVVDNLKRA